MAALLGMRSQMCELSLGFALGSFFDGTLPDQNLQRHHLLSGLDPAFADIGVQILADGLFHALMYVIAAVGLWLLWRWRPSRRCAGKRRTKDATFKDVGDHANMDS